MIFELLMQANIKPHKGSWEAVILPKQWIHYHCQKLHMNDRCHQTDQKCSFQYFLVKTDIISLKWKRKKKQTIPQTSNIFFPADTSFDGDKQNWAAWCSLKQQSVGMGWTLTGWDALGSPLPELLTLGMLALDTENPGVHKVHHTEFVCDVELRAYFTWRAAPYSFSSTPKKKTTQQFPCDFCACRRQNSIFTTCSTETFCQQQITSCLFTQEKQLGIEIIQSFLKFLCCSQLVPRSWKIYYD